MHMEKQIRDLIDRIAAHPELSMHNLQDRALASVRLRTRRSAQSQIGTGVSRIGGVPDVPPGFEWPRWTPPAGQKDRSVMTGKQTNQFRSASLRRSTFRQFHGLMILFPRLVGCTSSMTVAANLGDTIRRIAGVAESSMPISRETR
jgi:hypothetical protein